MSEELLYEIHDSIGRITFNRPQARNSFTFPMYERLREICEQAENDSTVKALVLTGAGGKAFAAGTDISQFKAFSTAEDVMEYEARIERVVGRAGKLRCPDDRRDWRSMHRRGVYNRGLLRLAHCHGRCAIRRAHQPHAWQLPVQGRITRGWCRSLGCSARERYHFHRAV